jgi:PIN domain nuclease of toxin-antitoxin system
VTHLLDTHTLIWSQDDPSRLGATANSVLRDPGNILGVSVVTVWEIGIKVAIGKLQLSKSYRLWIDTAIADFGLVIQPIALEHVERQIGLPFHHRDPFDRLLAAQSLAEGVPLVSADTIFDAYGVTRIWD